MCGLSETVVNLVRNWYNISVKCFRYLVIYAITITCMCTYSNMYNIVFHKGYVLSKNCMNVCTCN